LSFFIPFFPPKKTNGYEKSFPLFRKRPQALSH
jgi:hypothetical protein